MSRRALLGLGMAFLGWMAFAVGAKADTITVSTTDDEYNTDAAQCSLREAVQVFNTGVASFGGCSRAAAAGPSTILLPLASGQYVLTINLSGGNTNSVGDLNILQSMVISSTASTPTIRGESGWDDRLFHVENGALTIKKVSLGLASVLGTRYGGCIAVDADNALELINASVANCFAGENGGAIYLSSGGDITLTNTAIVTNTAANSGGGIFAERNTNIVVQGGRFTNNNADGFNGYGGGIYSQGSVRVGGALFNGNRAGDDTFIINPDEEGFGGAIFMTNGATELRVITSTFSSNTAGLTGGAIHVQLTNTTYVENQQPISIITSTFANNLARKGYGGGLNAFNAPFRIEYSSFGSNTADQGGGVNFGNTQAPSDASFTSLVLKSYFYSNTAANGPGGGLMLSGRAKIYGSTLFDNEANWFGGGVMFLGANLSEISNTTISSNRARRNGGGIFNQDTALTVKNSTIVNNKADFGVSTLNYRGGGIFNFDGDVYLQNNILANNDAAFDNDCSEGVYDPVNNNFPDPLTSFDFNLILDPNGCGLTLQSHDITGVDPLLNALAYNGGGAPGNPPGLSLPTHLPGPHSPVIDRGPSFCLTPGFDPTDERGEPRKQALACDIGAVEWGGIRAYIPSTMRSKASGW